MKKIIEVFKSHLEDSRNSYRKYELSFSTSSFYQKLLFKALVVCVCIGGPLFVGSVVEQSISQLLGAVVPIILWPVFFYSAYRFGFFFGNGKPYEKELIHLWESNGLVDIDDDVRKVRKKDGEIEERHHLRVVGKLRAIVFANSPKATHRYAEIDLVKDGSKFQDKINDSLTEKISSAIGLPYAGDNGFDINVKKLIFEDIVQPVINGSDDGVFGPDTAQEIYFFKNKKWSLTGKKNFSTLITGTSGSGKSYYSLFLLTKFLCQRVFDEDNHCYHNNKIVVIDPKASDLLKLCSQTMPEEYFGSSKADAFRILHAFNDELEKRKKMYGSISAFNTTLVKTGKVAPKMLVLEEFASLMSMFSSAKEKREFIDLLTPIILQGRSLGLGVMIITQKFNSDLAPTAIRENLNYKFLLGKSFSHELAATVFGSGVDLPTPPQLVGGGLFKVDSDGGMPQQFIAPRVDNMLSVIKDVWQRAYKEE